MSGKKKAKQSAAERKQIQLARDQQQKYNSLYGPLENYLRDNNVVTMAERKRAYGTVNSNANSATTGAELVTARSAATTGASFGGSSNVIAMGDARKLRRDSMANASVGIGTQLDGIDTQRRMESLGLARGIQDRSQVGIRQATGYQAAASLKKTAMYNRKVERREKSAGQLMATGVAAYGHYSGNGTGFGLGTQGKKAAGWHNRANPDGVGKDVPIKWT